MFNKNFYQPNKTATLEQAENRLVQLGYTNFTFQSKSISNGCSFYFLSDNNETIRVSDHKLTGKRYPETVIRFIPLKTCNFFIFFICNPKNFLLVHFRILIPIMVKHCKKTIR